MFVVRLPKGVKAVVENAAEREVTMRSTRFRVAERIDSPKAGGKDVADRLYILEAVAD